jgi:hypothetical protein
VTDGKRNLGDQHISEGTSGSTSSNTNGSSSPNNSTHIVVPREASTTHSTMAHVYPMIRLPDFHGDGSKDP